MRNVITLGNHRLPTPAEYADARLKVSAGTLTRDRVVTIGGGTGSFTMLSELKKVAPRLWAIVTMMDSGGLVAAVDRRVRPAAATG
jgi:Flp pilus assembly CpaF family ATPase